ncbi:ATP-binding protein [Clostridium sp.]|uniref:ATP-binding protein n=1 Tax=Clostridium sp. TaxID=1506 RepID=UPI00290BEF83|nr:ATP-binding protein [Clostridium sp.]MDU5107419.1 ATP-binding protein [Clostridium sp.]
MIKGYEKELALIYEKIRAEEEKNLIKRRKTIEEQNPEILELDNLLQKKSLGLSLSILKGIDDATLNKIKDEITDLRVKKTESLVEKGYDADYLNLHYRCPKCKDEGYIGINRCSCYRKKLVQLYYKNSSLKDTLSVNNFNNFNLSLFSSHKLNEDDRFSPRKNMENILRFIREEYIPNFNSTNDNLLFYGDSGTGKTFLSCCIAKELLDDGFLVIYRTVDELMANLREIKFENNSELENILINCDLLIIDDLGAEQITDFTTTEFFNLLNKKLLRKKKMIISTNLSLSDIRTTYTERISSRLLGNFKLYKFYTEDIRIQLNLKRR